MKKAIAIFLTIIFMITNSGIVLAVHYCGGKMASVNLIAKRHNCGCGNKAMKKSCCKDKTIQLKACEKIVNPSAFVFSGLHLVVLCVQHYPAGVQRTMKSLLWLTPFYHPPPFKPKTPIHIMDGVLLV